MKKLFILCSLSFLFAWEASSQVKHLATHKDDRADMVRANKNLLFTFSMVPKSWTQKDLIFYNLQGEELNKMTFDLEKGYELKSHKAVGTNTVMCFVQKDKMQILVIDKDGKEFARKVISEIKVKNAQLQVLDDNNFVLIHEEKVKKVGRGLIITKYDVGLVDKWNHRAFAEKGNYSLSLSASNKFQETVILYSYKYKSQLMFIDKAGKVISNKKLDLSGDGISNYDPYKIMFRGTEAIIFADLGSAPDGPYKSMPTGLSVMTVNNQGTRMSSSILDFMTLQLMTGDTTAKGKPLFGQVAPALRVLDVQDINGKPTLITESYIVTKSQESKPSTTAGSPPTTLFYDDIQIRELFLVPLANMDKIHRIWKPYVKYRIDGITVATPSKLCELAEENNLFGYQFMQNNNLVIKGISNNYCYVNYISPEKTIDHPSERIQWGEIRTISKGVLGYEIKVSSPSYLLKDAIYPTNKGVLIFHDHMATGAIEFKSHQG